LRSGFEPKIVAFCCNWSSYPAINDAGSSGQNIPPNVKFIRMMCGGMVTEGFVLKAFELGADGVLVATCPVEDCHYNTGSRRAIDVHKSTERIVEMLGIGKERLRLGWFSSNETSEFVNTVKEFVEKIRDVGPSPINRRTSIMAINRE